MSEDLQTAKQLERAKQTLRSEYLARRKMMSREAVEQASHEICRHLSIFFREKQRVVQIDLGDRTVFSYLSYGREINLRELHEEFWAQGRRLAVPRTIGLPPGEMEPVYLNADTQLVKSSLGVYEPKAGAAKPCRLHDLAAVLLPGVAFDEQGGRLGHGGGYYDRLLAQLPPETILIGVAYEWQVLSSVPLAEWDVPLDFLVTEKRRRAFGRN